MDHRETLRMSASILNERAREYGDPVKCFSDAATIATVMLRRPITPYDIAKIMEALKLAREAESPHRSDHYIDRINYTAFACQFSPADDPRDEVEDGIRQLAEKFAPNRTRVEPPEEG